MGVGGGVGVGEAPRVGGHRHIEGQGHLSRDRAQTGEDVVDQLAAGGGLRPHDVLPAEEFKGGVVVDGQVHPVRVGLRVLREQPHRSDVRGHHRLRHEALRRLIGAEIGGGGVRQLRVGQQVRRLPQAAEAGAQGGGAAHGVPVRADVGEDQHIVKGPQQRRGLGDGQHAHASVSPVPPAWASCSSTRCRISRMWAPCWMESSAMNCSSGV